MSNESNLILYSTDDGESSVALYAQDGTVWMKQDQIAELFATSVPNISQHVSNILKENELDKNSVIKYYLTTAADGKKYQVAHYALEMILSIGYRVRSPRGTQFRQWATRHLKEFLVKGFVMDDERLKNPDERPDYFDELLARIRDVRSSEKRFYQKLRDLFSLSSDYDKTDKATQMFFAEVQNKLLYAATKMTAPKSINSSPHLANLVVQATDGLVAFLLQELFALDLDDFNPNQYEDNPDFNDSLDELYPLSGNLSYSRALFDQDAIAYEEQLEDFRTQ